MNNRNTDYTTTKTTMNTTNTYITDVVPYLVDYYNQFGTLPTNVIECTKSGQAFTCFGTNLKKKVEKAGSIEALLTSFVGRGVIKKTAQKAVDQVVTDLKKKAAASRTPAVVTVKATA